MNDVRPQRHTLIAKRVEDLSMTAGIISTLVSLSASAVEPTGLSAFAVFLGIEDPPLVITLAPIIANIATATAIISGACFIFVKWKG
jgi:hypothetical protein